RRPPGQGFRPFRPIVRRRPGSPVRPARRSRRGARRHGRHGTARRRRRPGPPRPDPGVTVILFVSTADTEILALRAAVEMLPDGFPAVRAATPAALAVAPDLDGVDAVVVRLLGGRRA